MRTAVQGTCRLATVMGENLSRSVQRLGLEGEERARADGARARSEAVAVIRSGRTERHCVPPTHQRGGWRRQCENCVVYVGRKVVLKCARATVQIVCFFFHFVFTSLVGSSFPAKMHCALFIDHLQTCQTCHCRDLPRIGMYTGSIGGLLSTSLALGGGAIGKREKEWSKQSAGAFG